MKASSGSFPIHLSCPVASLSSKPVSLNKARELTGDYIAGLCQAYGSFSVVLRRTKQNKEGYLNLAPVFTLKSNKYKDLILEIQKKWGNIGFWYYQEKDNIRYQVSNQKDLLNVVIPFFMKYKLRSGKLLSFLKFKYIVETMATKAHHNNRQNLLSLIVIASHLNPLGKMGSNIRYLNPLEQHYVINNIQPLGVDISKLTDSINNFQPNPLTVDFVGGLWDGDGGLSVYFNSIFMLRKLGKKAGDIKVSIGFSFTIVQDIENLSLLNEIKSYFNNKGGIYELSKQCSIYKSGSKSDLISVILPKMINKESIFELDKDPTAELYLPFMKYDKIYYSCKILEFLSKNSKLNDNSLNEILKYSYYVSKNSNNMTFSEYVKDLKIKTFKN